MRLIEFEGKRAQITEDDWEVLLRRFDPSNDSAIYMNGLRYIIKIPCPLCTQYSDCIECPLDIFSLLDNEPAPRLGCYRLLKAIAPELRDTVEIRADEISWLLFDNTRAYIQLSIVYRALERLPTV